MSDSAPELTGFGRLVCEAAKGNLEARDAVFERLLPLVQARVQLLAQGWSPDEEEEAVGEICCDLANSHERIFAGFDPSLRPDPTPYLRKVVERKFFHYCRRRKKHDEGVKRVREAADTTPLLATTIAPEDVSGDVEIAEYLSAFLGRLGPIDRYTFQKRLVEGHSSKDVADTLEMSPNGVDQRVTRLRKRFRAWLRKRGIFGASMILVPLMSWFLGP